MTNFLWEGDEGRTVSFWQESSNNEVTGAIEPRRTAIFVLSAVASPVSQPHTCYHKLDKMSSFLNDGPVACGETSRTTAHSTWALNDGVYRMEDCHGEKNARIAIESHAAAINQIEKIVDQESIDCDFARFMDFLSRPRNRPTISKSA